MRGQVHGQDLETEVLLPGYCCVDTDFKLQQGSASVEDILAFCTGGKI